MDISIVDPTLSAKVIELARSEIFPSVKITICLSALAFHALIIVIESSNALYRFVHHHAVSALITLDKVARLLESHDCADTSLL